MINIRQDGEERKLSYEEFIRAIQEGRVTADTAVQSNVLTSGQWKPAGQLRFFRAWAPKQTKLGTEEPVDTTEQPAESLEDDRQATESEPAAVPREPPPIQPSFPTSHEEPENGLPGALPADDPIPWEQAERIGFGTGLYVTLWLAFRNTDEFFRRIPRRETLLPALLFGLVLFAISNLAEGTYGYLILPHLGDFVEEMQGFSPEMFHEENLPAPREILFFRGALVLFYPVLVFLWSGLAHLLLRAFERPSRSFFATFRMANYAMAPVILTVIPLCGNIVGWIWVIVLMARGLARVHRVGMGPAVFAALLPFILSICFVASVLAQPMMQLLSGSGGEF